VESSSLAPVRPIADGRPMTDRTSQGAPGWALDGFMAVALILVLAALLLLSVSFFVPR
jgi:hypothetical protein